MPPLDLLVVGLGEERAGCEEQGCSCCPGSTVYVWMTSIDEFHQELAARNYKYLRLGIEETFYGSKCVEVIDPFGNRIRFNEELPAEEPPA